MRRIVTVLLSTLTAVVLLFSYHTSTDSGSPSVVAGSAGGSAPGPTAEGSTTPTPSATPSAPSGSGPGDGRAGDDGGASGGAAAPTPTATASPSPTAQSPATKTYTGDAVDTRWGPVQVQITVTGGKVTAAQAVQYPNGNGRDAEINSYALPVLSQEAVQKQSAQIDTVSGATLTSDGYLQSLQSALDQAHL
jgi:uncharacterized protein with FMN-binding domain